MDHVVNAMIVHMWDMRGGGVWTTEEALDAAPPQVRARFAAMAGKGKSPRLASLTLLGRTLQRSVGRVTADGLTLEYSGKPKRLYSVRRVASVERIEIRDRDAMARTIADLEVEAQALLGLAGDMARRASTMQRTAHALSEALEREGTCEPIDDVADLLGAIHRAHGNEWRSLRSLGPTIGRSAQDQARFLGLVGGPAFDGLTVEEGRGANGWRVFRVVDLANPPVERVEIEIDDDILREQIRSIEINFRGPQPIGYVARFLGLDVEYVRAMVGRSADGRVLAKRTREIEGVRTELVEVLTDEWGPFLAAWHNDPAMTAPQRPGRLWAFAERGRFLRSVRSDGNESSQISRLSNALRLMALSGHARQGEYDSRFTVVDERDATGMHVYRVVKAAPDPTPAP